MYIYKKDDTVLEPYREGVEFNDYDLAQEVANHLIDLYVKGKVVNRCRHFEVCRVCDQQGPCFYIDSDGNQVRLTSCEIQIPKFDGQGNIFVNSSIIHYVLFHNYKPEDELIDALLNSS